MFHDGSNELHVNYASLAEPNVLDVERYSMKFVKRGGVFFECCLKISGQ